MLVNPLKSISIAVLAFAWVDVNVYMSVFEVNVTVPLAGTPVVLG